MENQPKIKEPSGHRVRAGKKKNFTEPPPMNPEKQDAREMGKQQFMAQEQLTMPATKVVLDKKTMSFKTVVYDAPVDFIYDEARKQFVSSPVKQGSKEKGER